MMDLANTLYFVGVAGAGLYLISYFMLQAGFIGGNSNSYVLMNLTAASLVLLSLITAFNMASVIIQVSWIIISIFGLTRSLILNRRIRFNTEEREFLDDKFVGLSKPLARDVLNKGVWVSGGPGTILTEQGVRNTHLIYLASGSADVLINDDIVAQCVAGNFIGEMTLHDASPASATVRLREDSRYLSLDANGLRELSKREALIAQALDAGFARDLRSKLHANNP